MFSSLAKYYEMGRPQTFNYRQSIFVATAIGAAGATHKVICPKPAALSLPNATTTIDYYTIARNTAPCLSPLIMPCCSIESIDFP